MLTWENCPAVERKADRMSGTWVFRGTRIPLQAIFENLTGGRHHPGPHPVVPRAEEGAGQGGAEPPGQDAPGGTDHVRIPFAHTTLTMIPAKL